MGVIRRFSGDYSEYGKLNLKINEILKARGISKSRSAKILTFRARILTDTAEMNFKELMLC